MRYSDLRVGNPIKIRNRKIDFSLWPVRHAQGGWVTNTRLFVAEPWAVIRGVVEAECPKASKPAALAFLEQSFDYYKGASTASLTAAKPVLLYYCFMNLVKVLILTRKLQSSLDIAQHGLAERVRPTHGEFIGAYLEAYPSTTNSINIFDKFLLAVGGRGLPMKSSFDLPTLSRQIVAGHRLFTAANKNKSECFIAIDDIQMLKDTNQLWLRLGIIAGDLNRLNINQMSFMQRSGLDSNWQRISSPISNKPEAIWFEQKTTIPYTAGWLPNSMPELIDTVRHKIWQVVRSIPPYRTYYLYLPPVQEQPYILPQLLSSYALLYYFGSITRYRPHHFDKILIGKYGPFVESFLHDQPAQMLFLMASEFSRRDIAKAAIV